MVDHFLSAKAAETVEKVRHRLAKLDGLPTRILYVTDNQGHLQSLVELRELIVSRGDATVTSLTARVARPVPLDLDQEAVASFACANRLDEVPVVDKSGKLIGVVPPLALIITLQHEHDEDVHRLAGILHRRDPFRRALRAPVLRKVRSRLPWLLIGLIGCLVSALLIAGFESNIQTKVAVAFFIPAIVYIADAIGTQTEAIVVRGLSHSHMPLASIFLSESFAGLLIGAALGAVALPLILVLFAEAKLALVVALSITCASAIASAVGLLLPWTLSRWGQDPAYGSGPLATIVQDVLSVSIYFSFANFLL
jgi:magnesium transporter